MCFREQKWHTSEIFPFVSQMLQYQLLKTNGILNNQTYYIR